MTQDLNRQIVSGESSDEEENNMAVIDTASDNITVTTTAIQNVLESKAVQELESDDEFSLLSSGIQVEGDDSSDLSDVNESDHDMSGPEDNEEVDSDDDREDNRDKGHDSEEAGDESAMTSQSSDHEEEEQPDKDDKEADHILELDLDDILPKTSHKEVLEISEKLKESFMYKCFAMLLLYINADMDYFSTGV